ncbi:hypothetical protein D3C81_1485490 [compost metagenome]
MATSSTWARFKPVSTKAGILPVAASTMIRPVGVGRTSRGPIGVDGLTMTAGNPSATRRSTSRSASTLLRL